MTTAEIAWRALLYWLLLPAVGIPLSVAAARMGHRGFGGRLIGWFIIVPAALGSSYLGSWPFFALVAGCAAAACLELVRLGAEPHRPSDTGLIVVGFACALPWIGWAQVATAFPAWAAVAALFLPALAYARRNGTAMTGMRMAALALSLGAALSFWILLERVPGGFRLVAFAFTVVVVNDMMAFAAGKFLPVVRLLPGLSPNKTLSGYVGGAASAVLIGVAFAFAVPEFGVGRLLTAALLLVVSGALGDLVGSAIKRRHAAKDFGSALGAHGGILDRLDSLMGAGWVFYVFLRLTQQ